jgi:fumarylpyruvate hydrolase
MTPAFAPHPPVLASIADNLSHGFPVRRLFCIGRNYADHAREMGKDPTREPPFFFTKWAEAVVHSGSTISYPPETRSYHHEIELVIAIGGDGFRIPAAEAPRLVWGYAVGLDMTRRDLQQTAKDLARPWDVAKNVEQSAPLGPITPAGRIDDITRSTISLEVNGATKQRGQISDMIWSVPEIIAEVSRFYRLGAGDLIFTGTPAGVGPVVRGDRLVGRIGGLEPLEINIGASMP